MPEINYIPTNEEWKIMMNNIPEDYQNIVDGIDGTQLSSEDGYYMYLPGLECDIHLRRIKRYSYCAEGKFHVKIVYNNKWREKGYENKEIENVDVYEVNKLLRHYLLDEKV